MEVDGAVEMLAAATVCELDGLIDTIVQFLVQSLSHANVWMVWQNLMLGLLALPHHHRADINKC